MKKSVNNIKPKLKISQAKTYHNKLIFGIACLASFFHFYIFNKTNMNVIDEMQYMIGALDGIEKSSAPSPVYFMLIKLVSNEFNIVENARLLNLVFLLIGLYPIISISKKYLSQNSSFLITLFYLFSPFSMYVTNVMPEILFGTVSFFFIYYIDKFEYKINVKNLLVTVFFINLLIGIKNIGIFFVPVILAFILTRPTGIEKKLINFFLFISTFILAKFLIDQIIYGEFSIFQKAYGQMFIANFSLKSLAGQLFLDNFFTSLIGNISLYFPFLLPSFFIFKRSNLFRLNYWTSHNYSVFIILSLLFFIFGTAFFSAGISEPLRIHERYYSFLFVPFLIFYLYFFSLYTFNSNEKLKFFLSFIFGILIVKFLFLRHYDINYIDNPDLFFIYSVNKYILFVLFIIMFGFLLKKSIKFTNLFFLILVIISTLTMSKCYLARKLDTPSDLAGKKVCSGKLYIQNVYVDNVVGFGFFYYQCPGSYNVFYFDNFNFEFKDRSIYIGNFVAENQESFSKLTKISESIFYKR